MFLRKPTPVTCFYCLSAQHQTPRDPRSFRCSECATWNRYSSTGEIFSDEPAMHDASLNTVNFSRRASPSKNSFPSSFASSVFCRTCQTNQTLVLNLLSNYLPDASDPTYRSMLKQLPDYKESLHQRYPPVCRECQIAVDDELNKKEYMARTSALGARLRESKRAVHVHLVQPASTRDILIWGIRGCLWTVSLGCAVWMFILGAMNSIDSAHVPSPSTSLSLVLLSLLWMFWDPTWYSVRQSNSTGQRVEVLGRSQYINLQLMVWTSRLIACGLGMAHGEGIIYVGHAPFLCMIAIVVEGLGFIFSILSLQIQRAVPVRLIDPHRHKKSETPQMSMQSDPGSMLSALTLTPEPVIPKSNEPVFGQTSTPKAQASLVPIINEDDEMDWTPTGPGADDRNWDEGWLKPQRFFAPVQPTGLEGLLERTSLRDPDIHTLPQPSDQPYSTAKILWIFVPVFALLIATISGILMHQKATVSPSSHETTRIKDMYLSI